MLIQQPLAAFLYREIALSATRSGMIILIFGFLYPKMHHSYMVFGYEKAGVSIRDPGLVIYCCVLEGDWPALLLWLSSPHVLALAHLPES